MPQVQFQLFSNVCFLYKVGIFSIVLFQNVNALNGTKVRVAKYLAPVLIFSILFNLPKFFEAQIEYVADVAGAHNISVMNLFESYVVL